MEQMPPKHSSRPAPVKVAGAHVEGSNASPDAEAAPQLPASAVGGTTPSSPPLASTAQSPLAHGASCLRSSSAKFLPIAFDGSSEPLRTWLEGTPVASPPKRTEKDCRSRVMALDPLKSFTESKPVPQAKQGSKVLRFRVSKGTNVVVPSNNSSLCRLQGSASSPELPTESLLCRAAPLGQRTTDV
uniref:Uncharacterized protein n=1 Tax=Eutreptiella gymnastica TaxID=73025 RepID=A0A7S4FQ41_9EUGL